MADNDRVEPGTWEPGQLIGNDLKAKVPTRAYAGDVAAKYGDVKTAIQSGNLVASLRAAMHDPGKSNPRPDFHSVMHPPQK